MGKNYRKFLGVNKAAAAGGGIGKRVSGAGAGGNAKDTGGGNKATTLPAAGKVSASPPPVGEASAREEARAARRAWLWPAQAQEVRSGPAARAREARRRYLILPPSTSRR
jgi:hypothetical protein